METSVFPLQLARPPKRYVTALTDGRMSALGHTSAMPGANFRPPRPRRTTRTPRTGHGAGHAGHPPAHRTTSTRTRFDHRRHPRRGAAARRLPPQPVRGRRARRLPAQHGDPAAPRADARPEVGPQVAHGRRQTRGDGGPPRARRGGRVGRLRLRQRRLRRRPRPRSGRCPPTARPAPPRPCKRLKPQELRALWLKALGHSYEEISTLTGFSRTKVNRCLAEGRKAFLERYEGIESGEECERWAATLSAIVDGEATAAQLADVRPHLRNCAGMPGDAARPAREHAAAACRPAARARRRDRQVVRVARPRRRAGRRRTCRRGFRRAERRRGEARRPARRGRGGGRRRHGRRRVRPPRRTGRRVAADAGGGPAPRDQDDRHDARDQPAAAPRRGDDASASHDDERRREVSRGGVPPRHAGRVAPRRRAQAARPRGRRERAGPRSHGGSRRPDRAGHARQPSPPSATDASGGEFAPNP